MLVKRMNQKTNPNWTCAPYEECGAVIGGGMESIKKRVRWLDKNLGKKHEAMCSQKESGEIIYRITEIKP